MKAPLPPFSSLTPPPSERVAVALSGGVDSALAAALLVEQGHRPQGVHLRLAGACAPQPQLPLLARQLGIPLLEVDLEEDFGREVVAYFLAEYARGRTPNPCVRCNAAIKFGRLWEILKEAGITHLATGHYVRVGRVDRGGWGLYRGVDRAKDQSYFLQRLPRALLPHLLFPLGEMTKTEVRARYRQLGLPLPPNPRESQELCFIPEGRYQDFIRAESGGGGVPGEVIDPQGRVLGRHRGLAGFTVGQRRGLGLAAPEPYYVLEIRPDTNRVVVGTRAALLAAGLLAREVNWLIDPPAQEMAAQAVIRYRHPGATARIIPTGPGEVRVVFATPQAAVAPGQAVAFYQGDLLLGGGWIEARLG